MKLTCSAALGLVASMIAAISIGLPSTASVSGDKLNQMDKLFHAVLAAEDPRAYVLSLSAEERALWEAAMVVVEVKEEPVWQHGEAESAQALLTSCWTQQKRRVGENILGYDLWRFYLRINWCENGVTVVAPVSSQVTVDVNYPFWSYSGIVGRSESGGPGYTTYGVYRQGEFKYCAPNVACVQYQYPWINLIGYYNGWSSWTGGGGTGW